MLHGKGMWIWRIEKAGSTAQQFVGLAQKADLGHVIIKIADGESAYPKPDDDPNGVKEKLTKDTITALQNAGITVWGYSFVYGVTQTVDNIKQAKMLAARVKEFNLPGVVINAEDIGRIKWSSSRGGSRAVEFMQTLKMELSSVPGGVMTAFSSYRYMSMHSSFPFEEFMTYCDIAMPQVYWVSSNGSGNAIRNLQDSYQEYKDKFPNKPFIPTGAAYGEWNGSGDDAFFWTATPEQITNFMNQAQAYDLTAVNFWSWQHARFDPANETYKGAELWDTIAKYNYGTDRPTAEYEDSGEPIEIGIGSVDYKDGIYHGTSESFFTSYVSHGRNVKFAKTSAVASTVWATWQPDITETGTYEIFAWVPGEHSTTRVARYHIHGVVGQDDVTVALSQNPFFNAWVSLGIYQLDANHPRAGYVDLNNFTFETDKEIAFGALRWQKVVEKEIKPDVFLADGFDSPVGTEEERHSDHVWYPMNSTGVGWKDASGFAEGSGAYKANLGSYHTGVDLNLNIPGGWNADKGATVYAAASGVVTFQGSMNVWGKLVVIKHDPMEEGGEYVYSRTAHLNEIFDDIVEGKRVERGHPIGTIGSPINEQGEQIPHIEHLHFDISVTEALNVKPGDWPGTNLQRLKRDYVDPLIYIKNHRPKK